MNSHAATIAYYDQNQKRYFERTHHQMDLSALQEFAMRIHPGGRILDAGCGTGRDLRWFNRMGFAAEGFDASSEMVSLAQAQSGCRVWQSDLMLTTLSKESYDGIWARHLLSHLPASGCQRAMGTFFAALKSGRILFVSAVEGEGSYEDRKDDPSGPARTLFRYRSDDFSSLLRQSGFQILVQGRNPAHPDVLAWIARRL
jgi:2-polyprenyl-3-methyl-5-hydroxy-6-metoxy-1,4-benzoquinol methylase